MSKARDLANAGTALTTVSATELGYLDGVTSAVQTQLNAKQATVSGVNDTEIGYLDGVTSAIQTQINSKIGQSTAINPSTVTTKGDILVATGSGTIVRQGVGTDGQVLVADSAQADGVNWATPAAGGMTLISTTTLTGASVTLSSIPQTYKNLVLIIRNFRPAVGNDSLGLRFNGNTTTYSSTGQNFANTSITGDRIYDVVTNNSSTTSNGFAQATIYDYTNTTTWKLLEGTSLSNNNTTPANYNFQRIAGIFGQTSAITSITALCNSGNFTSGTMLLYGVN
jgi:hypothetical protein